MAENPTALMQQLHDEHASALWGFCLHLTGDPVRAEDVAQETLLRIANRALPHRFPGSAHVPGAPDSLLSGQYKRRESTWPVDTMGPECKSAEQVHSNCAKRGVEVTWQGV